VQITLLSFELYQNPFTLLPKAKWQH